MYFPGKVRGGQLRLRRSPSTSGEFIMWIPNDTVIDCYTFQGTGSQEWLHANYNGTYGYVMARYVIALDGTLVEVTTQTDPLNVRLKPSSSAEIIGTVAKGAWVRCIDSDSVSGWYRITCDNGIGWSSSQYLTIVG